ncbi:MAG: flagellar export protein FliJ [Hyphomicrobiales bacterium]|nr:flagellar export protein FliJ [Hyphomicrobiales bacterium]
MRSKDSILRFHRFQFEEKQQQVAEIDLMIGEFNRKLGDIDQQIEAEETRSGVADPTHFNYSMTAKSLRSRHDNLVKSIDDLTAQHDAIKAQADEAEAELRKVELMAEKEGGAQTMPDVDVIEAPMIASR